MRRRRQAMVLAPLALACAAVLVPAGPLTDRAKAAATTATITLPVPVYSVDAAAVSPDGGIVALITTQPPPANGDSPTQQALIRIAPGASSLDTSFGNSGVETLSTWQAALLSTDQEGRILVGADAAASPISRRRVRRTPASDPTARSPARTGGG